MADAYEDEHEYYDAQAELNAAEDEITELRKVLFLFREFVLRNARMATFCHPMWAMVADALGGTDYDVSQGAMYRFIQPENRESLAQLIERFGEPS